MLYKLNTRLKGSKFVNDYLEYNGYIIKLSKVSASHYNKELKLQVYNPYKNVSKDQHRLFYLCEIEELIDYVTENIYYEFETNENILNKVEFETIEENLDYIIYIAFTFYEKYNVQFKMKDKPIEKAYKNVWSFDIDFLDETLLVFSHGGNQSEYVIEIKDIEWFEVTYRSKYRKSSKVRYNIPYR